MEECNIVGIDLAKNVFDLAKNVFQVHGTDCAGNRLFSKMVSRGQFLKLISSIRPCIIAMEACSSAHHWGRMIAKLAA